MIDLRKTEIKPLFLRGPSPAVRCGLLVLLAIVFMMLDFRAGHLDAIRSSLSLMLHPVRVAVDLPFVAINWVGESFTLRRQLLSENERLRTDSLENAARLQRLESLLAENRRLRALMESSARVADRVLVSEIMAVDLDPLRQHIVINKGTVHGAYRGQPLLDANGIVGQITHTSPVSSEAILISDASHAVPVQINRNGLRTIAVGTGDPASLSLPFLPNNADVEVGDLLVSSGLGGNFPPGYPVATISSITRDPASPFATVRAQPAAALNRNREVLLVWSTTEVPTPDAREAAER
ncbi:MAG: rod shape-determining protein MreC [Gammaproteobacteria bacterium]|nr:rod shape-determining protein MreC [Gammaproteobacteria bacterium]NNF60769.1 rod shape-determining protein MreC [Gammaproteobacteria bacterium]NNM20220.1 rod shape-determining protein MreC [Gammaproteobacteria bacterium]